MGLSRSFVLLAALLIFSFARASESAAGVELDKNGDKQTCTMCCRAQRTVDRLCARVDRAEEDLADVTQEFRAANRAVRAARAALSANSDRMAELNTEISEKRIEIVNIQIDIADGGETAEERMALRAQVSALRAMVEDLRAQLAAANEMRDGLKVDIEDAANDLALVREDARDERVMLRRAINMKTRAVQRLNACLGITPEPEPSPGM